MSGRTPTALIVEDEAILRDFFSMQLEEIGFDTVSIGDGAEALQYLQAEGKRDLLMADVRLGSEVDGMTLASHALNGGYADQIILISGAHLDIPVPTGMNFLLKPFTRAALISALDLSN